MGWAIFAFVLFCLVIEALIGASRGVKFSAVRFGYALLGTLIAILIAKPLTITILKGLGAANGVNSASITEIINKIFEDSDFTAIGNALAPHIAGLGTSVLIPLFFIPIFIALKFLTLIPYVITKSVMNNAAKKAAEEKKNDEFAALNPADSVEPVSNTMPAASKIGGAAIGAVMGLLVCAIITIPTFNTVRAINNSSIKEWIPAIVSDSGDELASDELELLQSICDSVVSSPALQLMKFTGTEALANLVLNSASTVKPSDIGAVGTKTKAYNLPKDLPEILDVVDPVSKLALVVTRDGSFSADSLTNVTEFVDKLTKAKFLDNADKLAIVNVCKKFLTDTIYKELGIISSASAPDAYDSLDTFKNDLDAIVEIGTIIADVPNKNPSGSDEGSSSSFDNFDVDALLEDTEKLQSFVSSALKLSDGPDIISNLVNDSVSKFTDGLLTDVVTPESIKSVGNETIVEVADSLMKFTKYDSDTVLTDDLKTEITDALDMVASKGIISADDVETIKAEFGLKK